MTSPKNQHPSPESQRTGERSTQPRVITKSDPSQLTVQWTDGHVTRYRTWQLRAICPCALCVDELSGVRTLDQSAVPRDLTSEDVQLVGTYALTVRFSDGHHTGIYPFRMLRANDPVESPTPALEGE